MAGINICLFGSYVYILKFRRTRKITPIVFWVAVLMFCFSTIHVSLGFYRLIRGFIDLRDQPGGPGAYFSDVSTPPNVAKVTIHSVNSILGDSIVVRHPCHHARQYVDRGFPIGLEVLARMGRKLEGVHPAFPLDSGIRRWVTARDTGRRVFADS